MADEAADRQGVLAAARLGWTLAEMRGRLLHPPQTPPTDSGRAEKDLPLGQERSEREQLIEYEAVLCAVAAGLNVNTPMSKLSDHPRKDGAACDWLRQVNTGVMQARAAGSVEAIDAALTNARTFFYSWDAKIQDGLAAEPPRSAAYQLGRGVAEIRWALDLDVDEPSNHASRGFLLGDQRGERLARLLDRLDGYYDPITRHALEYSLNQWRTFMPVAGSKDIWLVARERQATIWHDLILGQRDGASLVSPSDVLKRPANLVPIARRLAPEIAIMGVGAILLIIAAGLITSPGAQQPLGAIIATLGLLGVTAAGISARIRAAAMDLFGTVRTELYRGLVADQAIVVPGGVSPNRSKPMP